MRHRMLALVALSAFCLPGPAAMAQYQGEDAVVSAPPGGDVPPVAEEQPFTCDFTSLIGKSRAEAAAQLEKPGQTVRYLHEGDAVTREFMGGRVNVTLDDHDIVTNVTCG